MNTADDLAWLWAAAILALIAWAMLWDLRKSEHRIKALAALRRAPLEHVGVAVGVASIVCFLLWVLTHGRWFGPWTILSMIAWLALAFAWHEITRRRRD